MNTNENQCALTIFTHIVCKIFPRFYEFQLYAWVPKGSLYFLEYYVLVKLHLH